MKVIKIILILQSLIIISGLFYLTQKIFKVEVDLKLVKTKFSSLEEKINSVGSQADDLEGEVSSIKSKIDDIEGSIGVEGEFDFVKDVNYGQDEQGRTRLFPN